jgi:hypothetical protein
MTDRPRDSGLEIKADDDWKERVRQEARELDAARQSAGGSASPGAAGQGDPDAGAERHDFPADDAGEHMPLPPASFLTLVQMFSMQAIVAMGFIPDPQTGQVTTNLELARHFIDLLGVLEEKTKGRLSSEEEQFLTASLHELRMGFVELTRNSGA